MLRTGQKIKIRIEKIITGGDGMARHDGIVVMVPYAVPGDVLLVEITEAKRSFARGSIISVITPSPDRQPPACRYHFSPEKCGRTHCGGCNFQMLKYPAQIKAKLSILSDLRFGAAPEIVPAADAFRYRNKIQMPVGGRTGGVLMGFFMPHSHRIADVRDCMLEPETANSIVAELKHLINDYGIPPYDEDRRKGVLRHIILRHSRASGKFMLVFVTMTDSMRSVNEIVRKIVEKFPQITSVHQNINPRKTNVILGDRTIKIFGENTIKEKIGGLTFEISPGSFFQVNTAQAEKLYETVKKYAELTGSENVLDVYSGSGGISLYLARHCRKITGIEDVASAVADARKNAAINHITNARFLLESADRALPGTDAARADIVVLDPPRIGCSQQVISALLRCLPEKIIYTSCNPATLARDINLLAKRYKLSGLAMVDLFPQTAHIECVAKLTRC